MIACSERRRGSKNDGKYDAPRALLRDQQLDLPDPRLPRPRAIPIAVRRPCLGRYLSQPGADLIADLGVHDLAGDQRDRLPDEILKPPITHLRNDIGNRHALTFGHRGVSIHVDCGTDDEFGATVADLAGRRPTRRSSHHFYRHDP